MEHSPAVLLRKLRWSETSLIVTWLTEQFGTVKTVARGARKAGHAFAGKLDVFFQAEISFTLSKKGDLHTLREVGAVTPFDVGKAGSGGLFLTAYFAELSTLAAPSMHPAPEIYDLLVRAINHLQQKPASLLALTHFERELSRILGVYDSSGKVEAAQALASLYGDVPASRGPALRFLK